MMLERKGDGIGDFELHQWFSEGELERCLACGETAGVRLPASGSFLCLACGHVRAFDVEDAAGAGERPDERSATS
jgi:hypothetical protein